MAIAGAMLGAELVMTADLYAGGTTPQASSNLPRISVNAGSPGGSSISYSPDGRHTIVVHQTTQPISAAQMVSIAGTPDVIVTWNEAKSGAGGSASMYAFSLNGRTFSSPQEATNMVRLRLADFDPMQGGKRQRSVEIPVASPLLPVAYPHVYIVQFIIPPLPTMLDQLRGLGARPHIFMPDQAAIVTMSAAVRDQVAALPWVRWVGEFVPMDRLDNSLRALLAGEGAAIDPAVLPVQRYSIQVLERGLAMQQAVANRVTAVGGSVQSMTPSGFRLQAFLSGPQLMQIIQMNEVLSIEPMGEIGTDMDLARQIGGAVTLLSGLGITGQGVRGEVMDDGIRTTHVAFANPAPLIHGLTPSILPHGTETFGCAFGNGAANAAGTGMLPDREQGIFATYNQLTVNGGSVSRYDHTAQLVDPAGPYRAVFQSDSWGTGLTVSYTSVSAELDDVVFQHPLLICQSQSNNGNTLSRPEAWAKNVVAVGGIAHFNTLTRSDDTWTDASYGPAIDGRIKPELAHFYDNVLCTTSTNDTSYISNFAGTSAGTPIVAGYFGLLFQMWHQGVFAGFGGGASVFADRPKVSTARALMINSAYRYDWNNGGPNALITRARQGWGMPDLAKLYYGRASTFVVNETDLLTPGDVNTYQFNVTPGTPELRATMIYTDPMGNTASSVARINDLSLQVISPGNDQYWGNWNLMNGNWSSPGGSANTVDTVENVFVANPAAGLWTVKVYGSTIVQDEHLETPQVDADYALVVAGVTPVLQCPADVNGSGTVDIDDLVAVVTNWGVLGPNPADITHDGQVNIDDLVAVVTHWGACP